MSLKTFIKRFMSTSYNEKSPSSCTTALFVMTAKKVYMVLICMFSSLRNIFSCLKRWALKL
ncbi:Uncharacterised protein [Vibrio cholerae]|nr:Uncharacterised protein [Vibrio cholerae]